MKTTQEKVIIMFRQKGKYLEPKELYFNNRQIIVEIWFSIPLMNRSKIKALSPIYTYIKLDKRKVISRSGGPNET